MFSSEEKTIMVAALQSVLPSYEERVEWAKSLEDGEVDFIGKTKEDYIESTSWQLAAVKSALEKLMSLYDDTLKIHIVQEENK